MKGFGKVTAALAVGASSIVLGASRGARLHAWMPRAFRRRRDLPTPEPPLDPAQLPPTVTDSHVPDASWSPARLKSTLTQYLGDERVVVLANREPYVHDRGADGRIHVKHPASGLVTALEPVMRACSGVWIAHGSGTADRETSDERGRVLTHTAHDPGERHNLAGRPEYSQQESDLATALLAWLLATPAHRLPKTHEW